MVSRNNLVNRRVRRLFVLLIIFAVLIAARLVWLQLLDGNNLSNRLYGQVRDLMDIKNPRGPIYDANGKELAVSIMTKSFYANCFGLKRIKNLDITKLSADLAAILGKKPERIKELLTSDKGFIWLDRALDSAVYNKLDSYLKSRKINEYCGLYFIEESKRYYPNDMLAAQVLGFVGIDDDGLAGLEYQFDKELKGEKITQRVSTDRKGTPILGSTIDYEPLKQGKRLILTLDAKVQFIVEQAMDKSLVTTKAVAMTVVVMNPANGEIVAMASRPTFNPNLYSKATQQQLLNRATGMVYEPGSTFKPLVAAAAINEGLLKPDEYFVDKGSYTIGSRRILNWDGGSWGGMTFTKAFGQSINTIFVEVGMRLGKQRMFEYVRKFGYGSKTGIELPGEETGILFDPKTMTLSDLASMSIGQGIAVTPIQLITATAAMCNGGIAVKPHIVKEIQNGDGSVYQKTLEASGASLLTKGTAQAMALLFEKDVAEGGGGKAAVKGYHFGGKTGTAEKLNPNGGYASGHYISSFVGFGPVENPKYIMLVVIDDPQGVYYGGQISAPVFSEIMTQIMRYSGISQNVPFKQADLPVNKTNDALVTGSAGKAIAVPQGKVIVPNVLGYSIRDAGEQITKAGLLFVPSGRGFVYTQSLTPFSIVEKGSLVTVFGR